MDGRAYRRELACVAACAALVSAALLPQAFHIDEPEFLALAAQVLRDPLHPLSGSYNWLGFSMPLWRLNTNPLLWPYLLAGALKLAASERALRLLFLPFDVAAACGLYALAARFLKKPLWPTLAVLLCPAWAVNMGHLMGEKPFAAFGLWGVYAFVRSRESGGRWRGLSAALIAAACLTKYVGIGLVAACVVYGWSSGAGALELAAFAAAALLPLGLEAAWLASTHAAAAGPALAAGPLAEALSAPRWLARIRSLLCFFAGAGGGLLFAGLPLLSRKERAFCALAAMTLLIPALDASAVSTLERVLGWALAAGALASTRAIHWRCRGEGRPLWLAWMAAWAVLLLFLYPNVSARAALFLIIPATLALASALEEGPAGGRGRVWLAAAAFGALLSAGLIYVDSAYAGAQRRLAAELPARYPGRRVWFTGHWGLQYYLERGGGREIDGARGWDEVRPGDVVVIPSHNLRTVPPERPLPASVAGLTVPCALPLRPMSGAAAFYGGQTSFLPFTFSAEPLEDFQIAVIQQASAASTQAAAAPK